MHNYKGETASGAAQLRPAPPIFALPIYGHMQAVKLHLHVAAATAVATNVRRGSEHVCAAF